MKCCASLSRIYGDCDREATVERGGKPYCWQHDPERRKAAARARSDQRKAEDVEREKQWARQDLEYAAGLRPSQIANLTDEQLRLIADAGGVTAFICEP